MDIKKEIEICPVSPNCVSTMTVSKAHFIGPWNYQGEAAAIKALIKEKILLQDRVTLKGEGADYLHFVFRTKIMRFKDDVWIYIDDVGKKIHYKSASRIGRNDFGANKKRMNMLKKLIF